MKPKYHFFSNAKYALCGVGAMWRNEMAFRIEAIIILPLLLLQFCLPVGFLEHIILCVVLWQIFIAEAFNSAIEAAIDLSTQEIHPLAKIAKDCASAGVFFSICLAVCVWAVILANLFNLFDFINL